jgi:hypothetical protein
MVAHKAKKHHFAPNLPLLAAAFALSLPEPTFFRTKPGPAHKQSLASGMYAPGSTKVPAVNDVSAWRPFSRLEYTIQIVLRPSTTTTRFTLEPQGASILAGVAMHVSGLYDCPVGAIILPLLASHMLQIHLRDTVTSMIFHASWVYITAHHPFPPLAVNFEHADGKGAGAQASNTAAPRPQTNRADKEETFNHSWNPGKNYADLETRCPPQCGLFGTDCDGNTYLQSQSPSMRTPAGVHLSM